MLAIEGGETRADSRTGIVIDYTRNEMLSGASLRTYERILLREGENPQDGHARAARAWCADDMELAQRLYYYASKKWMMWASPVLTNAPLPGERLKAMPISCYLVYVEDTIKGILQAINEMNTITVTGGGVGMHWSDVRSAAGGKGKGIIGYQTIVNACMESFSQNVTRRGSAASFLHARHPDFGRFLNLRVATGGDSTIKCMSTGYNQGVILPNAFMEAVVSGGTWDLIDPHTQEVVETVDAKEIWLEIMRVRARTGEPYLIFEDNVKKYFPEAQKKLGLEFKGSNLCAEIALATNKDRTAVCCLSSLNLELWDEWKDTRIVEDCLTMLDNVLQYFIENAPPELDRAIFSAMRERAIGLGTMGFHSLLQRNNIAFESREARVLNKKIYKEIRRRADAHDLVMGALRGEAPDMAGTGRRWSHKLAIAPNATSSIALDTSPSIEMWAANVFVRRTTAGTMLCKNVYLEKRLRELDQDLPSVWEHITVNGGSVQGLDFLTDHEKRVFKTAREVDQRYVVLHAADRAPMICQAQSVNVFLEGVEDINKISDLHLLGWSMGLKSFYYYRARRVEDAKVVGSNSTPTHAVSGSDVTEHTPVASPFIEKTEEELLAEQTGSTCLSCEG